MDDTQNDDSKKKSNSWIVIILIILAIIFAIIIALVLAGVFKKGSVIPPVKDPGPIKYTNAPYDSGFYTKDQNVSKLPTSSINLDSLPTDNSLNNILRYIGISERQGYADDTAPILTMSNLNTRSIIRYGTEKAYLGTKYITNGNNVILFLDDFIISRTVDIDFSLTDVNTNNGSFKIINELSSRYNLIDDIHIDNTVNNLYIYGRGFGAGLAILTYFNAQNTGQKNILIEGFPAFVQDPDKVLNNLMPNTNRNVFYNYIQDPMVELVKTNEYYNSDYVRLDNIPYNNALTYASTEVPTFKIHEIVNYLE